MDLDRAAFEEECEESADFEDFLDPDDNPFGSGGCRVCGGVLLDDLDDFVEAVCFSCQMDVYRHADPAPLGFRIAWAIRSAWGWPRRALITWRIHRDLNRAGLPF